jgi:hypothetical protein
VNNVNPDKTAWMCRLIWIYLVAFRFILVISDQGVNIVNPDKTAWMCRLIWIHTGFI